MLIYRAYKTELKLNNRERTLLVGCAGAARFAFNWGLSQKISEYAATGKSPNYYELHRRLNALKKGELAWFYKYSKTIPQEALRDLEQAFQNQAFLALSRANEASAVFGCTVAFASRQEGSSYPG